MDDSEGDAHDLSAYTEPPSESNSLLDLMAGIGGCSWVLLDDVAGVVVIVGVAAETVIECNS